MGASRLLFPEPPLRPQVLEKWVQAIGPVVFSLGCRETAGDVTYAVFGIGETRPAGDGLFKDPGWFSFEKDDCAIQF